LLALTQQILDLTTAIHSMTSATAGEHVEPQKPASSS
jgi:hypothetical protein